MLPSITGNNWRVIVADVIEGLQSIPDESVQCCVTSPPYFQLRDYGIDGQIGLEKTPEEFIARMVGVFREVRRVLRDDGVLFVNMGDSYNAGRDGGHAGGGKQAKLPRHAGITRSGANVPGLKPKDLIGIPWALAFALRADGWYLRQDIIWHKRSPMPESVRDRCTKAHEYIFLLTKSPKYFWDQDAVKEGGAYCGQQIGIVRGLKVRAEAMGREPSGNEKPGANAIAPEKRNPRSVWTLSSEPYSEAHFATFPSEIPRRCIKAGTSEKGCCGTCGAPWERVTEKTRTPTRPGSSTKYGNPEDDIRGGSDSIRQRHVTSTTTKGWQPTCECVGAEIVPCTVLDCFSGSGTTGMVATELGRRYIGCELNPNYAEMSRRRIESWKLRDVEKAPEPLPGQLELFGN